MAGWAATAIVETSARTVLTGGRTSRSGEFVIKGLPFGPGTLKLRGRPSGAAYVTGFDHQPGGSLVVVRLPRGTEVSGTVVGVAKEGLRHLRVALAPVLDGVPSPLAPAFVDHAKPDGEGSFRFSGVPPGRYVLLAHRAQTMGTEASRGPRPGKHPRSGIGVIEPRPPEEAPWGYVTVHQWLEVSSDRVSGRVLRFPAESLRGTLRRGRTPLAHADLLFQAADLPEAAHLPPDLPCLRCVALVPTDAQGRFVAPALPAGDYRLRVSAGDLVAEGVIRLQGGEKQLRLEVGNGGEVVVAR